MVRLVFYIVPSLLISLFSWCRSIDTDDFRGDCSEDSDIYADFGKYPGIELDVPIAPHGKCSMLKAVKQAIDVAEKEYEVETELKKEEEKARNWQPKDEKVNPRSAATNYFIAFFTLLSPLALVYLLTI